MLKNKLHLFNCKCEVEKGRYEIYISEVVLSEISDADPETEKRLTDLINKHNPIELRAKEEVKLLSEKYVSAGIIPKKFKEDAIHIAYAAVYDLNAIVSWNLKHIVKLKTRIGVNAINRAEGYREIEICTPEEVIEK